MAATLTDIRAALAAALSDIGGITNVYTTPPDQVNPPCIVIQDDDPLCTYAMPDGIGLDEWHLRVLVIVARVSVADAQALLDQLFDPTVIKTTVQHFDWLSQCPSVSNAEVVRAGRGGPLQVGDIEYLARPAYVSVFADSGVH